MIQRGLEVVFVTGSGLSAPSGIPTFRGADNSCWANYVLEWGTRAKFEEDPRAWWNEFWLPAHVAVEPHSLEMTQYQPNAAHEAIATLARAHASVRVVTQNIDALHGRSGVPEGQLVEVHGREGLLKCIRPGCRFATSESTEAAMCNRHV